MTSLFEPLAFAHGPRMKNRFMLAPLTNLQSHDDGILSEEEFRWLTKRAEGGFGLTSTCAAHVQAQGQGFPGQLGIFSDAHISQLARLAAAIRAQGSLAFVQLHHAGARAPKDLTGLDPVAPSAEADSGARALRPDEVEQLIEDFIAAALRADRAGFDGVELHGAHGYILCQFFSVESNRRDDKWGGSFENRTQILREIIAGIRARCRPEFQLGVRLSPERFGVKLMEMRALAAELLACADIDFVDMSMWDVFKEPVEEEFTGRSLMSYFTELPRSKAKLGVAGKIATGDDAARVLREGADFAIIGRSAILHHDFPQRVAADPHFKPIGLPVSAEYLAKEGLSPKFIAYMRNWKGFVAEP